MTNEGRFKAKGFVRTSSTTRPIQALSFHMIGILLQCVLFISVLSIAVSEALCNSQDRESLLWFSGNVSSSVSPLNWNPSIDCCSWEGITCDDSPDSHITAISLPFRALYGKLPLSVLRLHHLSQLNLSHNRLSGHLPSGFLSALDQLKVLDLSYNSLDGELPVEQTFRNGSNRCFPIRIVDLSSNFLQGEILPSSIFMQGTFDLISFNVSKNSFTGSIPSFMCKSSPQLSKLDFSYNDFTGNIPQGLGRCLKLSVLQAGFNNISGEIPSDIYNLSELEQLFLPVNHLSGKINDDITHLTKLKSLELYSNHLGGEIPMDIGQLSRLQSLQLHINNITGTVPPSLANCTNLVKLNLRLNRLEGTLSELDFSRFQSLSILDLGNNSFSGDFPWRVHSCKSLSAMRFASNKLTGQISPHVLELESLSILSLSDNKLMNITGALGILQGCRNLSTLLIGKNFYNETFPSDKDLISSDGFPNLQIFASGGSGLRGEIPAWLIKLKSLAVIDLSHNQLVGSIPGWLGTFPHLFYIDLSENLLSGELPKDLFQLKALMSQKAYDATERNYLKLPVFVSPNNVTTHQQYNQLFSLPPGIYIRRNNLKGSIPIEVGQLKVLHVLELSHNYLSGIIPHELSKLTSLERLDLSNNHLSGRIPWSLTSLHYMSYFNVVNNSLDGPIPTGSQFDTFPQANFKGNPLLCGGILLTSCKASTKLPATTTNKADTEDEEELKFIFILGVATGFFVSYCFYWCFFARLDAFISK
ncbi:Similar to disease resistance proteins [Arabidopsis thaliana]|jgi:Leucine-rich repeat (LRR) protein|uniref:Receptor-like protein 3 n=4 Tax=Arabidopsis TaxID=3701 RepID=RLP3_ARATH|nr:receptor like protein 3 [Arabidopsis thaliana]Q9SHI4.1 RecName: Full=Receptor-like protein 3; Short=AtRLP3; AltName: Full=Protein RESISTANCE TO FUSARIUM OXYSPORUM 2; Flags: Precursor [Arabidopsis thaliana]KAG7646622.1 Leucine-rich repeat [Arabidopsis thaliana x Arabidopsis arenosa]KAG7654596.1 Leucine-rich repeat [Arabidopsis suecica]AAD50010.1 Similar to disease resistance proteins [Arabidopsis thaliana]AEE29564.1 receptor like protein 3 [Arabidopsis thaliana]OAP16360.1 RLP3 [Arabidopsis |eukprot:NP_173168.1 receptor like protein 3 [Arabidopsis thaliana]